MIAKEFFTIDEAAAFLSQPGSAMLTRGDILRFCEEGAVPISFKYRGRLGFFSAYSTTPLRTAILFPKPLHTCYFNGYLTSKNPCRLADVITGYRASGRNGGMEESVIVRNTLRPHQVEILKLIHCDPVATSGIKSAGFWGRVKEVDGGLDSMSIIPEVEWLVHISHLVEMRPTQSARSHATTRFEVMAPSALPKAIPSRAIRVKPNGGDSITPLIWELSSDLRDQGDERIMPRSVMAALKALAAGPNMRHPLLGVVTGGVKYERENGVEDELDIEQLRHRIRAWRHAHQSG